MKRNFTLKFKIRGLSSRILFLLSGLLCSLQLFAAAGNNQFLVYQGKIVDPSGTPINTGAVTFTLSVLSPLPTQCVLYSENQTVSMTGAQGAFSLNLGEGTRIDAGSANFGQTFLNGSGFTGLATCASGGGTYTPGSTDDRTLAVSFNDGTNVVNLQAMYVKSVPFSLQAHSIDGWGISNIVKVSTTGSSTTFTTGEMANVKTLGGLVCTANQIPKWNGTAWACAADATGSAPGNAGYGAANLGTVAFDTDAATSGITVASGIAKLSTTTATPGAFGSATQVATFTVDAQGRLQASGNTTIAIAPTQITAGGATSGQVLKYNGTNWVAATETDPTVQAWAKAAPAARFSTTGNVLDLATSGVTASTYGSANQVPVFTVDTYGRVTGVTNTTISGVAPDGSALTSGKVWVGNSSNVAAAVSVSGDVSLSNTGAASVNKISGSPLALATPATSQYLRFDGTNWVNAALSASDVTTGTLSVGHGGTGTTTFTANQMVVADGTGSTLESFTCTSGQALAFGALGIAQCENVNGASQLLRMDASGNANFPGNLTMVINKNVLISNNATDPAGLVAADKGRIWFNSTSNQLKYWDGSAIQALGISGAGLTSLNGQNGSTQTFGTPGTSGTAPAWTSATNVHTLNIPMASAASVTAGLLSNTDYAAFTAKLGTATAFSGDVSGAYNATSVDKIKGTAVTIGTLASGNFLRYSGTAWVNTNLVAADIPNLDASKITSGILPIAQGGTNSSAALTNNQVMVSSGGKIVEGGAMTDGQIVVGKTASAPQIVTPSGDATMTNAGVIALKNTGTSGTYYKVATDAQGRVTSGGNLAASDITTALTYTPLNKAGDTMLGTLGLEQLAADPTTTGWNATQKGFTWFNTSTNQVKYWDGSAIQALGISGAGLTSLNGQGGSTQTFATPGTSGTAPAWSSATNIHTLNIPLASAASVTAGLLSNTDYATFTAKLGTATTFSGDVSGAYNATSVDKIKGTAVTITTLTSGNFLRYNGTAWVNTNLVAADIPSLDASKISTGILPIAQGGTNSSAALTNNQLMVSNGGKVIEGGAMTDGQMVVGKTGSAPQIVTVSGAATMSSAGVLTLATVPVTKGGTAATSFSANQMVVANGSGNALISFTCSLNQVLSFDASGNSVCQNVSSVFSGFVNGGNSFAANATIGTNDNFTLGFKTNNGVKMTLDTSGNLGLGTSTPANTLDIGNSGGIHITSGVPTSTTAALYNNGGVLTWNGAAVGSTATSVPLSGLTAATASNSIANGTNAQTWSWTSTTTNPMTFTDNSLTTGSILSINTSNTSVNSTSGLLSVTNSGTSTSGVLAQFQANSSGTGMTILNNGTIGIGTTSPSARLDVEGGAIQTNAQYIAAGTAATDILLNSGGTYYGTIQNDANNTWSLGYKNSNGTSLGTPALSWTNSGNVGIGTTSPTTTLQVTGVATKSSLSLPTAATSNNISTLTVGAAITGNTGGAMIGLNAPSGYTGKIAEMQVNGSEVFSVDHFGGISGATIDLSGITTQYANIYFDGAADAKITNAAVGSGAGTLTIGQTGETLALMAPKVGIGTATPANALDIGTSGGIHITSGVPTSTTAALYNNSGTLYWNGSAVGAGGSSSLSGLTAATASNSIANGTNPQTWSWTSTTTNPMTFTDDSLTTGSILSINTSNTSVNSTSGLLNVTNSGTSTSGVLAQFQSNSTAGSGMTITNAGKVGIGVAAPNATLEVNGNFGITNTTYGAAPISANGHNIGNVYTGENWFSFNGSQIFDPANNIAANVKIPMTAGGSTASAAFGAGVSGSYSANTYAGYFNNASTQSSGTQYGVYAIGGTDYFSGNVGIGTTSPRTALDVAGALVTKAATSNAGSTIDFSVGNVQYTGNSCGSFQLNNIKDGGSYTFIVQGGTAATCTFTAYSDAGSTALTVHMPPDNGSTTAGKHTIYSIIAGGSHVYVAWTPGY